MSIIKSSSHLIAHDFGSAPTLAVIAFPQELQKQRQKLVELEAKLEMQRALEHQADASAGKGVRHKSHTS